MSRAAALHVKINPANRLIDKETDPQYREVWLSEFDIIRSGAEAALQRDYESGKLDLGDEELSAAEFIKSSAIKHAKHVIARWAVLGGIGVGDAREVYDGRQRIVFYDDPTVPQFRHRIVMEDNSRVPENN